MAITSCINCTERHLGCHSTCKRYIEQKEEHDKEKQAMFSIRAEEQKVTSYLQSVYKRKKQRKAVHKFT